MGLKIMCEIWGAHEMTMKSFGMWYGVVWYYIAEFDI
jgi:hypothetical protein